jgi:hypothetical protein
MWLVDAGVGYFRQAIGGVEIGLLSLLLIFFYIITSVGRGAGLRSKPNFCWLLVILVAGSILAAIIGAYPFGGIRQHLFAAPLIVLCVAQAAVSLGSVFGRKGMTTAVFVFGFMVFLNSLVQAPPVYAERQDIISAVSEGLEGVPGSNVYVYYAAKHALKFHYPEHQFVVGPWRRGDIDLMGKEIIALTKECSVHVLFSHVTRNEDDRILDYLGDVGLTVVEDKRYSGARVVKLSRCGD